MVPVIVVISENMFQSGSGTKATFPVTIITAIVSPIALPNPRMIAADTPDMAAGKTTFMVVSHLEAPIASDASL